MTDLLARLEDATEGSRELDRQIMYLAYNTPPHCQSDNDWPKPYTTSIDAALTLVPDAFGKKPGWWGVRRGGLTYFHAWIGSIEPYGEKGFPQGHWAQADTPALALCIAALKARETET